MTIARGKVQERFSSLQQDIYTPDPFSEMQVNCKLLKVYDMETLEEDGVSEDLAQLITSNPGWLFGRVQLLNNGTILVLPFEDSEELIYTIYGNRVLLEGRTCVVVYKNLDIQNGFIKMKRGTLQKHINLQKNANTFDFSGIL